MYTPAHPDRDALAHCVTWRTELDLPPSPLLLSAGSELHAWFTHRHGGAKPD